MVSVLISVAAVIVALSLAVLAGSVAVFVRRWLKTAHAGESIPADASTPSTEAVEDERVDTPETGGKGTARNDETAAAGGDNGSGSERDIDTDTDESGQKRPVEGSQEAVLLREKLRAYREIMHAAVSLNRAALELNQEEFRHAADAIAFDQESELREPYLDANQAFESNLYIIDEQVRQATSEFVDYLATYHDEGAHAGGLLGRAGDIYEAMRTDLGLESLFGEDAAPPKHGTGDIMPDPSREDPEIEDFTEELGKPEDLEFFSGGKNTDDSESGADSVDTDTDTDTDTNNGTDDGGDDTST